jgi:hypothetical protein
VLLIEEPARTFVVQNIFVLRAIHFSIGHFPLVRIFCSEGGFLPNAGYFRVSDACNSNQRSTRIIFLQVSPVYSSSEFFS